MLQNRSLIYFGLVLCGTALVVYGIWRLVGTGGLPAVLWLLVGIVLISVGAANERRQEP